MWGSGWSDYYPSSYPSQQVIDTEVAVETGNLSVNHGQTTGTPPILDLK